MATAEEKRRKKRITPQPRAEPRRAQARLPAARTASVGGVVGREKARIRQPMGQAPIAPGVRARGAATAEAARGAQAAAGQPIAGGAAQSPELRQAQVAAAQAASAQALRRREQDYAARGAQPSVVPRERADRQGQAEGAAPVAGGTYYAVGTRDLGREAASSLIGLMSNPATREGALRQWEAMSPEEQAKYPVMAQQAQVYRQTHERELAEEREEEALAERERQREQVEEGREDVTFEQRQADRERRLAEAAEEREYELGERERIGERREIEEGREDVDYLSREEKEARQAEEKRFANRTRVLERTEKRAAGKLDDLEAEAKKLQTQRANVNYDLSEADEARLAELMGPEGLIAEQRKVLETAQGKLDTHLAGEPRYAETPGEPSRLGNTAGTVMERLDAGESIEEIEKTLTKEEIDALTDDELDEISKRINGQTSRQTQGA